MTLLSFIMIRFGFVSTILTLNLRRMLVVGSSYLNYNFFDNLVDNMHRIARNLMRNFKVTLFKCTREASVAIYYFTRILLLLLFDQYSRRWYLFEVLFFYEDLVDNKRRIAVNSMWNVNVALFIRRRYVRVAIIFLWVYCCCCNLV